MPEVVPVSRRVQNMNVYGHSFNVTNLNNVSCKTFELNHSERNSVSNPSPGNIHFRILVLFQDKS